MSTVTLSGPAEKYLDAVHQGLSDLPEEDIEEVLTDLATHISELGDVDPETTLGSPEEFIAEFRASAGLDDDSETGRFSGRLRSAAERLSRAQARVVAVLEPIVSPVVRHRSEIRTAWIWSRGTIAVLAYAWTSDDAIYGRDTWLAPRNSSLLVQLAVLAVATAVSVQVAHGRGKWWARTDTLVSLGVVGLVLVAMTSPRFVPTPEEQGFVGTFENPNPVLLIGPNGPIQNLYAYDASGNPVEVFLYDEYGNPILTLPEYAYQDAAEFARAGEPFVWEGYELRFQTDVYGRPVGNLYPLKRYEWTETGARSAPQPPPVVGIPELPAVDEVPPQSNATDGDETEGDEPVAVTTTQPVDSTATSIPPTTAESPSETTTTLTSGEGPNE